MSFANHLVSSALLTSALFSIATFPLAAASAKPVSIELDRGTVFNGPLKDAAVPYLLAAATISVGVGVTNLALMNWRQSSRKLASTEEKMLALKQQLTEKESQLEHLAFSQSKLNALGLNAFLEESELSIPPARPAVALLGAAIDGPVVERAASGPVHSPIHPPALNAPISGTISGTADRRASSQFQGDYRLSIAQYTPIPTTDVVQRAATAFPSAQAFMGFARPKFNAAEPALSIESSEIKELELSNPAQISEVLSNLKRVMAQLETLRVAQQVTPQTGR